MKVIFSRKGFDSSSGGGPSPIVGGRPISLPIPTDRNSRTSYHDLKFAQHVHRASRGKLNGASLCHHDPMFVGDRCIFGQTGAAQSHLARHGIGPGDVFLFFGLFADEHTGERHHRFFGYLRVETAVLVADLSQADRTGLIKLGHPHALGSWFANDMVYVGKGKAAGSAPASLRLTRAGGPLSQWRVPPWLRERGLSYHGREDRWLWPGELRAVSRGQEFVCDIGDDPEPTAWVDRIMSQIDR